MTSYSPTIHGPAWVADRMFFVMGDESVEPVPVTPEELRPTLDGFFVHPQGDSWPGSDELLTELGVLVLIGDPGTGRGTAALRRLREQCRSDQLIRLEAHWDQPRATLLPPAEPDHGYLLDVSEYGKSPSADFGTQLLSWARDAQAHLAVLTREDKANEPWVRPLHQHIVRAPTPAGRALAMSMLRNTRVDLVGRLDDEAFSAIWESSPRASEVLRLVEILHNASPNTTNKDIAEEFLGWQNWFTENCPPDLGSRALIWSAAMCDGGRRRSLLTMSEILRTCLGQSRTLVDVFSDDFASQRMARALVVERGGRAHLDPQSHGLAAAVRLHLWEQFDNYRDELLGWSIDCALELEADDAQRVVTSVMDLAVRLESHVLVQKLFDGLVGKRPELLVEVLSRAALDPALGSYVRGRLYAWLAAKPSQEKVDIVAEVCGGEFGLARPGLALTRLGRAALKSPDPVSPALVTAFTSLGDSKHRRLVLDMVQRLLNRADFERAGITAFLCLAGIDRGIAVLCGEGGRELATEGVIESLADAFQKALALGETHDRAVMTALRWRDAVSRGLLGKDNAIELFAAIIGRDIDRDLLTTLTANEPDAMRGFFGDVVEHLIRPPEHRPCEMGAADGPEKQAALTGQELLATATDDTSNDADAPLAWEGPADTDEA